MQWGKQKAKREAERIRRYEQKSCITALAKHPSVVSRSQYRSQTQFYQRDQDEELKSMLSLADVRLLHTKELSIEEDAVSQEETYREDLVPHKHFSAS